MAQRIGVTLKLNGTPAILEVVDDGVGFELESGLEKGGFGLTGMRERAAQMGARLVVSSSPEHGTCVRVEVDT